MTDRDVLLRLELRLDMLHRDLTLACGLLAAIFGALLVLGWHLMGKVFLA